MVDPITALQRRMVELGEGQKEFGARIGLSQATMSRILAGEIVPQLATQIRLEQEHSIKVEWWPDPRAEYLKQKRRRSA